jgi:hypothetical protein
MTHRRLGETDLLASPANAFFLQESIQRHKQIQIQRSYIHRKNIQHASNLLEEYTVASQDGSGSKNTSLLRVFDLTQGV